MSFAAVVFDGIAIIAQHVSSPSICAELEVITKFKLILQMTNLDNTNPEMRNQKFFNPASLRIRGASLAMAKLI